MQYMNDKSNHCHTPNFAQQNSRGIQNVTWIPLELRAAIRGMTLLVCVMISLIPTAHAERTTSSAYAVVTQQQEWLNVSRPLTEQDLEGRIVLLDFWTYCCVNCQQIVPDLHYLEAKFGSKLTVIGVHSGKFNNEQDSNNIRAAMLRFGITHPVVNDANYAIWRGFSVRAWPTFVLIGPDGQVYSIYNGEGHRDDLEADIARLIAQHEVKDAGPLPIALEENKVQETLLRFPEKFEHVESLGGTQALFVADSGHNRIVGIKLSEDGKSGSVFTTIGTGDAGLKDGTITEAQFNHPQGLAYNNGVLYVADTRNHAIRKIDFMEGEVTTIAGIGSRGPALGGKGLKAEETALASPWDIALYPDTEHLAITNTGSHQLLQLDLAHGTLDVIAGSGKEFIDDGALPDNSLAQPSGLAVRDGRLYFVDAESSSLRMLKDGVVSTLIGTGLFDFGWVDGLRTEALFQHPQGVFVDDKVMYVADTFNNAIRLYDPAKGTVNTIAGSPERGFKDGMLEYARFSEPSDVQRAGDLLYIADTNNNAIRVLDLKTNNVSTLKVKDAAQPEMASAGPNQDTPAYPKELPNLLVGAPLPKLVKAGGAIDLKLKTGWKINHEAPSTLKLFAVDGQRAKLAHNFPLDVLMKRHIPLPKLDTRTAYLLQGTLYYCQEKGGSTCQIRSVHHVFKLDDKGVPSLVIPLE